MESLPQYDPDLNKCKLVADDHNHFDPSQVSTVC